MKNLKHIDLFAGIGGFRIAVNKAGYETVWTNDIDKMACDVYEDNFGKGSVICDDINNIPIKSIPKHDLLTAGFPCQPFSAAGKKMGTKDKTRGTLFEKIIEVLEFHQPKYFLLENVRRLLSMDDGIHFKIILEALASLNYFIEWRLINPLQFGIPQNRDRVFIYGIKNPVVTNSHQTLEKYSVLLDETDLENLKFFNYQLEDEMKLISNSDKKFGNWGIAYSNKFFTQMLEPLPNQLKPKLLKDLLEDNPSPEFDFTGDTLNRLNGSEKIHGYINGVEVLYNQKGGARMGYTVFGVNGVAPTLTASTSRHYERYKIEKRFRRLTNIEYARLMGFPDNWCNVTTSYNQYFLYGNAVVPQCVEWIVKRFGQKNIDFKLMVPKQPSLLFQ